MCTCLPASVCVCLQVYSESVIPRIAKAASGVTGTPYNELMNSWGVYFLGFVGKYGYDRILKVLGRHVRDFVNGLDNLHEYLRFSYPKVQPPTFFCQEESATGVTLHYRSRLLNIRQLITLSVCLSVCLSVWLAGWLSVWLSGWLHRLNFDNSAYRYIMKEDEEEQEILPITSDFFFEVFPFNIVFRQVMAVNGNSANAMESWGDGSRCLKLKGQMRYMPEWESIIFLGTPVMESLSAMFKTGLYINDLSMHDSSRDLVLAGIFFFSMSSSFMKMLDYEMKKTDDLLYRMIPKPVAKRLRKGEPVFPDVTILFSDVVGFTRICSHITPMQVVSMLNTMYTLFDTLSENPCRLQVETIGDAYMVVAGAPEKTKYHAHNICDMALDMVRSIDHLKDPSNGNNIQIRVGIHSGMVVAGVVGHKMPRYGLHGDTVHTASAMESNGKVQRNQERERERITTAKPQVK
uniref:guanylate cyclase n=1 Tax=Myripristis murdjan TaxID=586833 RepID=A0A667ZUK3_9TELE